MLITDIITVNMFLSYLDVRHDFTYAVFFSSTYSMWCRKRQSNAAAVGSNNDEVKTFTVPCNIDVHLDKATVRLKLILCS